MAATSATAGAAATEGPSGYARFCNNTLLSDVVLVVGKGDNVKRFSAHRVVLAAASPQLAALVIKDEKSGTPGTPPTPPVHTEIAFPDDHPAEFQLLLSAIYGDATALSPTATARLLPLVSKYGVKEAADACVKAFGELTPETALAAYALLPAEDEAVGAEIEFHRVANERKRQREEKKGAPKKAVVEKPPTPLRMLWLYLLEQAQDVINLPAFKELPLPKLEALLSSEMLNLDEPSVFRVLLDRAKAALSKEKKEVTGESMRAYLGDLIKHCRFPLFSMSDLATVVAPTGILSGDEMVQMFQFSALPHTDRPPTVAGFKTSNRSGSSSLLVIKLWGGGGAGGQHSQGNGGGAGGFISANYRAVPGEELRIIVGRGGTMADDAAHSGTGGGLPNGGHGDQNYRSGGGGGSSHVISVTRFAGEVVIGAGGGGGGSGGISSASGGGGGGGTYDGKVGRGGRGGWTSAGWDAGVGVDGGGGGGQGTSSGTPGAGSGEVGNTSGYFSGGGGRNGAAGTHGHGAGGRTGTGGGSNGGGGGGGAASAKYVEKESIRIVCGSSSSAVGTDDPHFRVGNNGEGGTHGGGAGRPGRVVIIRGNGVVETFDSDGTFTV